MRTARSTSSSAGTGRRRCSSASRSAARARRRCDGRPSMASNNGKRSNDRLTGPEVVTRVRREFPQLLGRPIESVLGFERSEDDGNYHVTVQVVELSRIPHTTDVMGAYAVTLDADGELVGYRRTRRYHRNQAD